MTVEINFKHPLKFQFDLSESPTVSDFVQDDSDMVCIMGPFGSGKTGGVTIKMAKRMMAMPPDAWGVRRSRMIVIRNTYPELKRNAMKSVFDWFPEAITKNGKIRKMGWGYFNKTESTYYIGLSAPEREGGDKLWRLEDGTYVVSEVIFQALDNLEDADKILGGNYTDAWLNEYVKIPLDLALQLFGRIGRYPSRKDVGGVEIRGKIYGDSNPPDFEEPWWKFFEEPESEDLAEMRKKIQENGGSDITFRLYKQPSGLAPDAENIKNLPGGVGYYHAMAISLTKAGQIAEINTKVHGQYGTTTDGKAVYFSMYDEARHRSRKELQMMPDRSLCIGIDFGIGHCAAIYFQRDSNMKYFVLRELEEFNCPTPIFLKMLKADLWERFNKTPSQVTLIGEPAAQARQSTSGRSDMDVAKEDFGFNVVFAYKEPSIGIRCVSSVLTDNRMLVDPRCRRLLRGFAGGYYYTRNRDGEIRREPKKNEYSEFHDALKNGVSYFEETQRPYPIDDARSQVQGGPFVMDTEWNPMIS